MAANDTPPTDSTLEAPKPAHKRKPVAHVANAAAAADGKDGKDKVVREGKDGKDNKGTPKDANFTVPTAKPKGKWRETHVDSQVNVAEVGPQAAATGKLNASYDDSDGNHAKINARGVFNNNTKKLLVTDPKTLDAGNTDHNNFGAVSAQYRKDINEKGTSVGVEGAAFLQSHKSPQMTDQAPKDAAGVFVQQEIKSKDGTKTTLKAGGVATNSSDGLKYGLNFRAEVEKRSKSTIVGGHADGSLLFGGRHGRSAGGTADVHASHDSDNGHRHKVATGEVDVAGGFFGSDVGLRIGAGGSYTVFRDKDAQYAASNSTTVYGHADYSLLGFKDERNGGFKVGVNHDVSPLFTTWLHKNVGATVGGHFRTIDGVPYLHIPAGFEAQVGVHVAPRKTVRTSTGDIFENGAGFMAEGGIYDVLGVGILPDFQVAVHGEHDGHYALYGSDANIGQRGEVIQGQQEAAAAAKRGDANYKINQGNLKDDVAAYAHSGRVDASKADIGSISYKLKNVAKHIYDPKEPYGSQHGAEDMEPTKGNPQRMAMNILAAQGGGVGVFNNLVTEQLQKDPHNVAINEMKAFYERNKATLTPEFCSDLSAGRPIPSNTKGGQALLAELRAGSNVARMHDDAGNFKEILTSYAKTGVAKGEGKSVDGSDWSQHQHYLNASPAAKAKADQGLADSLALTNPNGLKLAIAELRHDVQHGKYKGQDAANLTGILDVTEAKVNSQGTLDFAKLAENKTPASAKKDVVINGMDYNALDTKRDEIRLARAKDAQTKAIAAITPDIAVKTNWVLNNTFDGKGHKYLSDADFAKTNNGKDLKNQPSKDALASFAKERGGKNVTDAVFTLYTEAHPELVKQAREYNAQLAYVNLQHKNVIPQHTASFTSKGGDFIAVGDFKPYTGPTDPGDTTIVTETNHDAYKKPLVTQEDLANDHKRGRDKLTYLERTRKAVTDNLSGMGFTDAEISTMKITKIDNAIHADLDTSATAAMERPADDLDMIHGQIATHTATVVLTARNPKTGVVEPITTTITTGSDHNNPGLTGGGTTNPIAVNPPPKSPPKAPTPVPVPVPTPIPTPTPHPTPTPIPTPHPTPTPTPITPTPGEGPGTPTPTPIPTPIPTPVPTPIPTPIPTPVPMPIPTPVPTPIPTPVPTPIPTPVPTPVNPPCPEPCNPPIVPGLPAPTVPVPTIPTPPNSPTPTGPNTHVDPTQGNGKGAQNDAKPHPFDKLLQDKGYYVKSDIPTPQSGAKVGSPQLDDGKGTTRGA